MTTNTPSQRHYLGAIPGFINYDEQEQFLFCSWKRITEEVFERYGFTPFLPRPVEFNTHLQAKGGLSKQIYGLSRLHDDSLTDIGLPFDHTVPLALYVAQKRQELVFPFKRYDTSWSFRGESPQVGRYRAFIQADVDIIDRSLDTLADFECVASAMHALSALEIGPFTLCINHIEIARALIAQAHVSHEQVPSVLRLIDKLDKVPANEIAEQISALVSTINLSEAKKLVDAFSYRGAPSGFTMEHTPASSIAMQELQTLYDLLLAAKIPNLTVVMSSAMVRGLDYYTGMVFETFLAGQENFGSISSGGRYSNLVDGFCDQAAQLEGVGISIGLTRLFDLVMRTKKLSTTPRTVAKALIGYRTPELRDIAIQLAQRLRANKEQKIDLFTTPKAKVGKQLDYANRKGIPFSILVMDTGAIVVKDLANHTQQEFERIEDVLTYWDTI